MKQPPSDVPVRLEALELTDKLRWSLSEVSRRDAEEPPDRLAYDHAVAVAQFIEGFHDAAYDYLHKAREAIRKFENNAIQETLTVLRGNRDLR